jgi:uncharacterized surface protein with fasciclin (FAS1) repeats
VQRFRPLFELERELFDFQSFRFISPNSFRHGPLTVETNFYSSSFSVDIVCKLQNTKTFCDLVQKAAAEHSEFGEDLNGGANHTIFAPTDEAFAKVEDRLLKMKPNELYRTLLFHFNEGVVKTFDELACSEKLTSLSGDTSRTKCVRQTRGVYTKYQRGRGNQDIGENPLIDIKTKPGCSGILHRVDTVMLPIVFKPFKDLVIPEDPPTEDVSIIINGDDLIESEETDYVVLNEPVVEEDVVEPVDPEPEEEVETVDPVEEEVTADPGKEEIEPPVEEDDEVSTDDLDPIGSQNDDVGTQIETPKVPDDLTPPDTTVVSKEPSDDKSGPRIGALGINLIIFSTLLLCFVFVCMRR